MQKIAKKRYKQQRGSMLSRLRIPGYNRVKTSQNTHIQTKTPQKEPKTPWILRFFSGLGVLLVFLWRLINHFGRKNIPLALGIAFFVILFLFAAYNALFRQSVVSRPVLFSTRTDIAAVKEADGRQKRIFVEKILTTEALKADHSRSFDKVMQDKNFTNTAGNDVIGAFIARQEREFDFEEERRRKVDYAVPHPTEPVIFLPIKARQEQENHYSTKLAVPKARPKHGGRGFKKAEHTVSVPSKPLSREKILRVQRALQKAGHRRVVANGIWNIETRAAVRSFQRLHNLKPTGQIDSALIAALKVRHLW